MATPLFMRWLCLARDLALPQWCIAGGAVRSLVWDALHGRAGDVDCLDIDVVYFDADDSSSRRDDEQTKRLNDADPSRRWDVVNQAGVHRWRSLDRPFRSVDEGIGSWPEFATAVGVRLEADGTLTLVAPHGLGDLFDLRLRHNASHTDVATYRRRLREKRFAERWPLVRIDD